MRTINKARSEMKKLGLMFAVLFVLSTHNVSADPGPYSPDCVDPNGGVFTPCQNGPGFEVYNAINYVFTQAGFTFGVGPHPSLTSNADWADLGGGVSSNFAAISITAANNNTLGVYPVGSPGTPINVLLPQTGE